VFKKFLRELVVDSVSRVFPKVAWNSWEKKGYHVIRIHYYQPIPDTSTLTDDLWNKESELAGVDMNEDYQIELLNNAFPRFKEECVFPKKPTNIPHEYYIENYYFAPLDAAVLHCMIRHFQPKRIIEIGSGFSTYVSAKASLLNMEEHGVDCELTAIEPYPNPTLERGFRGLSHLIAKPLEQVELSFFSQLKENDILFIDSSHVSRIGGDINYIYLEILPKLNRGVIVHVHDIFFPKEYPKGFIFRQHWFFTEQYILQAFLTFNTAFRVLWGSNYMLLKHKGDVQSVFPNYLHEYVLDTPAASFWIQRKP
jgi:predicted O-methyltransferase YrrM